MTSSPTIHYALIRSPFNPNLLSKRFDLWLTPPFTFYSINALHFGQGLFWLNLVVMGHLKATWLWMTFDLWSGHFFFMLSIFDCLSPTLMPSSCSIRGNTMKMHSRTNKIQKPRPIILVVQIIPISKSHSRPHVCSSLFTSIWFCFTDSFSPRRSPCF